MDDRASHGLESVHVVVMTGGSRTYGRIFRTLISWLGNCDAVAKPGHC